MSTEAPYYGPSFERLLDGVRWVQPNDFTTIDQARELNSRTVDALIEALHADPAVAAENDAAMDAEMAWLHHGARTGLF
jgi:hypothetical protein